MKVDAVDYRRIVVSETTDIERGRWPVLVRINMTVEDPAHLFLVRYEEGAYSDPVPFQIVEVHEPRVARAPGAPDPSPADEGMLEICFFTELSPGETRRYLLYLSDGAEAASQRAVPERRLKTEGSDFGLTVDTGKVIYRFDPYSGQLLDYNPVFMENARTMSFIQDRERPAHWNPDIWAPPEAWGHTSDWNSEVPGLTPQIAVDRGPLLVRHVRRGVMPHSNGTVTEVSYTMFAGMPFILEASRMHFTADTGVRAVRNNELVFNRGVHTHGVWPESSGPQTKRLFDPDNPGRIFGRGGALDPIIPWIALYNQQLGYGIGIVNLEMDNSAPPGSAGPRDDAAHYYLLDYGEHREPNFHYNFSYMCRALVFRRDTVPAGAVYAERSAFVPFELESGSQHHFGQMERYSTLLHSPPEVNVFDN